MGQHNGTTYAYLGDAIYELMIREYLLNKGLTKVDNLHKEAIKFTSAEGQEKAFFKIEEILSELEMGIFKRGRNAKSDRKARNASLATYKKSTGFEALIGYLYLENQIERLDELFDIITCD